MSTGDSPNRSVPLQAARKAGGLPLEAPPCRTGILGAVAIAALVLAAMAATFTLEQDYDAHWHLAAGDWMLQHQRVLDHDPFTSEPEDPSAPWVNVYWLFQLTMAAVHKLGGFPAITVVQCLLTGAAFLLFALSLRGRVPTAWLVLAGLVMLPVFASRVRMRPEMFTLPFLLAAVLLVEGVRRGGAARRLWWLVPMMLTWVNMHGLYFLGLVVMWGAMLGAVLDKRLGRGALAGNLPTQAALAPMLVATAACLVSPWPLEAAVHPLVLWTRISGREPMQFYTYGVSEFRPTWDTIPYQYDMLILLGAMAAVMVLNYRRVPLGHLAILAPVLALAMMAVRNVALLGPVCGPLVAWHGGSVLRRWGERRPRAGRLAAPAAAVLTLAALAATAGYATEYTFRFRLMGARFGAGLCPDHYMTGLAQWLGEANFPGDVLAVNFGEASVFLYHGAAAAPPRRVWMDGRLEIKSLARFRQYQDIAKELATPAGADSVALPKSVRFLAVSGNDSEHLAALSQADYFRLIRLDRVGALFVRLNWSDSRPPSRAAEELPDRPNLEDFDRPIGADGLVEGFGSSPRLWYRQNADSQLFRFGAMMLALGAPPADPRPGEPTLLRLRCARLAARYLEAACAEDTAPALVARGTLAQALQQWARLTDQTPSPAAPIDVDLARALCLHSRLDLLGLTEKSRWTFGMAHVQALLQGGHLDAAAAAAEAFPSVLPPRQQMFPSNDFVEMRDKLRRRLASVRAGLLEVDLRAMSALLRARALTTPQRGLSLEAARELEAAPNLDANARLALGDLLLRLGRPDQARARYRSAQAAGAAPADVALRTALCEWVEGRLPASLAMFEGRPPGPAPALDSAGGERRATAPPQPLDSPAALYYKALLLEELGHYARAKDALRAASAKGDTELAKLIERARARL
jgi:tetratricopeptide (TPR) repeat protein